LSNFHDVDDLSTRKEKSTHLRMRKMVTALEDDHEQQRRFE
jgi:hypothetical protein